MDWILLAIAAVGVLVPGIQLYGLIGHYSLMRRAETWPKATAEVTEFGSDEETYGFGKDRTKIRRNWAKVRYEIEGKSHVATMRDAHTPGSPGGQSVTRRSDKWRHASASDVVRSAALAVVVDEHTYKKGQHLQVSYDPENTAQCMRSTEIPIMLYVSFLVYGVVFLLFLRMLYWVVSHGRFS